MNREQRLNRLEREWKAFSQSFAGLPDSALVEPNVTGQWSVRDILAHVTTWEGEALKALPLILKGKPLPRYARFGGIDAFNAREQERKRDLSLDQIKQELAATHERLVALLKSTPKSAYASESRFVRRLRLDTYKHYREHGTQIAGWRKEMVSYEV